MLSSDPIQMEAEAALRRIAVECRGSIDDVLEIMAEVARRQRAGECMLCFFNLYRKLPSRCLPDVALIKRWLEREIRVVATDEDARVIRALPCRIAEQDLEDFCHRVMEESKALFSPGIRQLVLEFQFAREEAVPV